MLLEAQLDANSNEIFLCLSCLRPLAQDVCRSPCVVSFCNHFATIRHFAGEGVKLFHLSSVALLHRVHRRSDRPGALRNLVTLAMGVM